MTKKTGIVTDPWRFRNPKTPTVETPKPNLPEPPSRYEPKKGDYEDEEQYYTKTVEYPNYGGVTLTGATDAQAIAKAILQFCVDQRSLIDDILVEYGILVARIQVHLPSMPFHIARDDGWTLTIPTAETRGQGLLSLIQCLLAIDELPPMRRALRALGLQPYRL